MFDFLDVYPWLVPVVIFFGRIVDVTLGTLRIIFVSKGERTKAPLVGFFEVFIWIVIISQIISRANNLISYLAYAGGYAAGNYVGIWVENKIAFGFQIYRIYATKNRGASLIKLLNADGFGSTLIRGEGAVSEVDIIETVVSRKAVPRIQEILREFDPEVFYYVEDIRSKQRGIFTLAAGAFPRLGK
jgi:uncharacterized protein YebE (UPF0316 family)